MGYFPFARFFKSCDFKNANASSQYFLFSWYCHANSWMLMLLSGSTVHPFDHSFCLNHFSDFFVVHFSFPAEVCADSCNADAVRSMSKLNLNIVFISTKINQFRVSVSILKLFEFMSCLQTFWGHLPHANCLLSNER